MLDDKSADGRRPTNEGVCSQHIKPNAPAFLLQRAVSEAEKPAGFLPMVNLSVTKRRETSGAAHLLDYQTPAECPVLSPQYMVTVYDPTPPPLFSTKILKSRFGGRRLFGSPSCLAMLEESRLHQKRQVGRVEKQKPVL
jgi:hypothetical protein